MYSLTNLSYQEWNLIRKMQLAVWGSIRPDIIPKLLDEFQRSRTKCGFTEAVRINSQLAATYARYTESHASNIKTILRMLQNYAKGKPEALIYIQKRLLVLHDQVWTTSIPVIFQYKTSNFFTQWLFAAHLWVDFSRLNSLVLFYWYCFQIEEADIQDLPNIWEACQDQYSQLINNIDALMVQSWFWQFVFRIYMRQVKQSLHDHYMTCKARLKNRLSVHKYYMDIGLFLFNHRFLNTHFLTIYDTEEITNLMVNWEIFCPEYMVMYKVMTQQSISESEQVIVENRDLIYLKRSVIQANHSAYIYQRIIIWLVDKPINEVVDLITASFAFLMSEYPDFLYQLRENVRKNPINLVEEELAKCIEGWKINLADVSISSLDIGVIKRTVLEDFIVIIKSYDRCISIECIKEFTQMMSSIPSQLHTGLTFEALRGAQVIWKTLLCVLDVKETYTDDYPGVIRYHIKQHRFLPRDIANHLQAYICVIAKYVWIQTWGGACVAELCEKLSTVPSGTFQKGINEIRKAVNIVRKQTTGETHVPERHTRYIT